jgi:putative ABC transport system permease protein
MRFSALVVKNVVRQRVRTVLTVLGIGVGITTVVALGAITGGLKATAGDLIRFGGADFMVAQKGSADLSFSTVSERDLASLERTPGVARATGALMHFSKVGSSPFFMTFGVTPERLADMPLDLVAGRRFRPGAPDEAILGEKAAGDLGIEVGGALVVERMRFRVVGVYRVGAVAQDAGAIAPLATVQRLARKPGVVTVVYVTVDARQDPRLVAARIERAQPQLTSVSTLSEYGDVDQGLKFLDAGNLAISVLAVLLGGIGVMNTMIMSVFERTREIGILRAVGWSGSRIVRMVIGESLLLCFAAALMGLGLGWLAARGVAEIPSIQSYLEPQYSGALVVRALAVAIGVALAGAAYPAIRAVRLLPVEALRHE